MLLQQYRNWCRTLSTTHCSRQQIQQLKECFKRDINSQRRYDHIDNVSVLIKILEKRDCVSLESTESLKTISNILAIDYEQFICDVVGEVNRQTFISRRLEIAPEFEEYEEADRKVFDIICSEIGQKWKDFARALNIKEGEIDTLSQRYSRDIPSIVRQILIIHKSEEDERYWFHRLQNALRKARRSDLSDKVAEMHSRFKR